jgi:hypothetical protein
MVRRWLIRGLALTLLTLSAVAWVGSYFEGVQRANNYWGYATDFTLGNGSADIWVEQMAGHGLIIYVGWMYGRSDKYDMRAEYEHLDCKYFGFGVTLPALHPHEKNPEYWSVFFPLWFPTLLSALFLWLVWRNTRPRYNGKGFPIQVGPKNAPQP